MSRVGDRPDYGAFIPSQLDDYPLTPAEFRVFCHISRRAGTSNSHYESIAKTAAHCKMNVKTARNAISLLHAAGLVSVQERVGKTSVITPLHFKSWAHPDRVESIRESLTPTKSGRGTESGTPTKRGSPPLPDQVPPPYQNRPGVPLPKEDHKGTPIEGTPTKVTPSKVRERDRQSTPIPDPIRTPPENPGFAVNEEAIAAEHRQNSNSSAARFEARFQPEELDPWQVPPEGDRRWDFRRGRIDPDFCDWLTRHHLPTLSTYKDRSEITRAEAEGWVKVAHRNSTDPSAIAQSDDRWVRVEGQWEKYQDHQRKRQAIAPSLPEPLPPSPPPDFHPPTKEELARVKALMSQARQTAAKNGRRLNDDRNR